jgi:hypothetical protein
MGSTQAQRSNAVGAGPAYIPEANPSMYGGNTYTGSNTEPTQQDYENLFGPSGRDIKQDLQRFKRHGRWHLPDYLRGPNPWLTDRIDGLITDATNSPFTTKILPYRYKEDPDGKIKWNVWSFDEGLAERVPYESAARTLTQSKRSFAAYMVRHGLAITMEHNFLASPAGRTNFQNQLNQLVGSIQHTNDLDVHIALILAPSYQRTMREKYYSVDKSPARLCRDFVDLFGIMQKNPNALDIMIEEAKAILRTWAGPQPDFLLCNSKLTFQMTMVPEKTSYFTQGPDGIRKLKQGPDLGSYRGISIVHTRSFSMEAGQQPRDLLRRRVRTAEYYRILPDKDNLNREFEFYNEERDCWFSLSFKDLLRMARFTGDHEIGHKNHSHIDKIYHKLHGKHEQEVVVALGQPLTNETRFMEKQMNLFIRDVVDVMSAFYTYTPYSEIGYPFNRNKWQHMWWMAVCPWDMGVKHIEPTGMDVWDVWKRQRPQLASTFENTAFVNSYKLCLINSRRLTVKMNMDLYNQLKTVKLANPYEEDEWLEPGSSEWFNAYGLYTAMYRRGGTLSDAVTFSDDIRGTLTKDQLVQQLNSGTLFYWNRTKLHESKQLNILNQLIPYAGTSGCVNSCGHLLRGTIDVVLLGQDNNTVPAAVGEPFMNSLRPNNPNETLTQLAFMPFYTFNFLKRIFRRYVYQGRVMFLLDILRVIPNDKLNQEGYFNNTIPLFWNVCQNGDTALSLTRVLNMGTTTVNNRRILTKIFDHFITETLDALVAGNLNIKEFDEDEDYLAAGNLASLGIDSLSMEFVSWTRLNHPYYIDLANTKEPTIQAFGHLSSTQLDNAGFDALLDPAPNFTINPLNQTTYSIQNIRGFWNGVYRRCFADMRQEFLTATLEQSSVLVGANTTDPLDYNNAGEIMLSALQLELYRAYFAFVNTLNQKPEVYRIAENLKGITIDLNGWVDERPPEGKLESGPERKVESEKPDVSNVEIVVIRPNIEHNMLGIILGEGGDGLGNTLWGQTELSCYDDSMHGIWGMSYKYHARAIVFNEKNLIRLWDIAYDGYNGGKDDTYVDWTTPKGPNGYVEFTRQTLDISKSYRGPSMMVLAFLHDPNSLDPQGMPVMDKLFRRNWPSPIVFYDSAVDKAGQTERSTLPIDCDNLEVVDVQEFRVFNNDLYKDVYKQYRSKMPDFAEMHRSRKSAGQSSHDAETPSDSLAFQGTMRIRNRDGRMIQEILGSGHHGPDYIGVSSVREGKGLKQPANGPQRITVV